MQPNAVPCGHCGAPTHGTASFCCSGCETAWQLINEGGWQGYYKVRDPKRAAPVKNDTPSFAFLNTAQYRETHTVPAEESGFRARWYLNGLHCPACTWLVERICQDHAGVLGAEPRFSDGCLDLWFAPDTDLCELAQSLAGLGYVAGLRPGLEPVRRGELLRLGISGALAANLMLMSLPFYSGLSGEAAAPVFAWVSLLLALPLLFYGARDFFVRAWAALACRLPSLDLPIAAGLMGAFVLSTTNLFRGDFHGLYYDSMGMLVFFLLLGRFIQGMGVQRALAVGRKLLDEMPRLVTLIVDGARLSVPAQQIQPGDMLELETGDPVPVDGTLDADRATLNLYVVSGESRPVELARGDRVLAGSVNMGGTLRLLASDRFDDSRFARLENLSRDLRGDRPTTRPGRLATPFLTAVCCFALAGLILWWPVGPLAAIEVALTVFIVACPCALALAEPTARAFAWGLASRLGIQLQSEDILTRLAAIRHVVFDKTGILTAGQPALVGRHYFTAEEFWLDAAVLALESCTRHPLVGAFQSGLTPRLVLPPASDVRVVPGAGVRGLVCGRDLVLCAPNRLDRFDFDAASIETIKAICEGRPGTLVCALLDGRLAAIFTLSDALRPELPDLVSDLRRRGLTLSILSGDRLPAVADIADRLAIEDYHAELLPEQKLSHLHGMRGQQVLMAGDGLNDMGALAAAGVAVTHDGAARAAVRFADVVFQTPEMGRLEVLFSLAATWRRAIRLGLAVSICYNLLAVTLALRGNIGPLGAALLMPLSSLSLIGLVALCFKRRQPWAS